MFASKSGLLVHDFLQAHDGAIEALAVDTNSHYFYSAGESGKLKKWDSKTKKLHTDYGQAHGNATILSITISRDYMFTGDGVGRLKCWSVTPSTNTKHQQKPIIAQDLSLFSLNCLKDFGPVHSGGIESTKISHNNKWLFTTDHNGFLKQWSLNNEIRLHKNYGNVMGGAISSIAITPDDMFLYLTNEEGNMKKLCVSSEKVVKKWDKVMDNWINNVCISPDGSLLWLSDYEGFMKCWSLESEETVKDYKKVGSGAIHCMDFIRC